MVLLFLMAGVLFANEPDHPQNGVREFILHDIQSAVEVFEPNLWDVTMPKQEITLDWCLIGMENPVVYSRRVLAGLDGKAVLLETWSLSPEELEAFGEVWGRDDWDGWGVFLAEIPQGRVVVSPGQGSIMVYRDFAAKGAWHAPAFPLNLLPTSKVPFPEDLNAYGNPSASKEEPSKFAAFWADMVNEELADREGVPISISKTWHFRDNFSRVSPNISMERRIKLNFAGTYSVFDVYEIGSEFLLGDIDVEEDDTSKGESGAFLELDKRAITIRHGYKHWYEALFAKPFPPDELPYNQKNLAELPMGVRVVSTTTAGASFRSKWDFETDLGEDYPIGLDGRFGTRGTYFTSVVKRITGQIELRYGARIERPFELGLRLRPDFDGPLDPRRILMGTILQARGERIFGSRLFFQTTIDIEDEESMEKGIKLLRSGLLFRGIVLGFASVLNVSYFSDIDSILLEKLVGPGMPDLDWQQKVAGSYRQLERYGKIGLRPISFRSRTNTIADDWTVVDLESGRSRSGRSGRYILNRNSRLWNRVNRRKIEVLSLPGLSEDNDAPRYTQITDLWERTNLKVRAYRRISDRMKAQFETSRIADKIGSQLSTPEEEDALLGYRIILNQKAMAEIGELAAGKWSTLPQPFKQTLRFHPFLRKRIKRHLNTPEKRDIWVAKFLFLHIKNGRSWEPILEELDSVDYVINYKETSKGILLVQESDGSAGLPEEIFAAKRLWEELSAIDDIFSDRTVGNSLQ